MFVMKFSTLARLLDSLSLLFTRFTISLNSQATLFGGIDLTSICGGTTLLHILKLLLQPLTLLPDYKRDHQNHSDDKEPDKLCSNTFFFLITELTFPAGAANALSISALTAIHTDTSTACPLLLKHSQSLSR
jgi:hypothetical protein